MLCIFALLSFSYLPSHTIVTRMNICEDIVNESLKQGIDPALSVSIAFEESRFTNGALSNKGAVGPMQVLAKYWCSSSPAKCNKIKAGVSAIKYFLKKYKNDSKRALEGYAGKGARARAYARRVFTRYTGLKQQEKNYYTILKAVILN